MVLRISLTAVLLLWIISRVGIEQLLDALGGAELRFIFYSMFIYQAGVALRSFRWWMLLQGAAIRASYSYVLGLVYISEFYLSAIPASFAGDLARIVEFNRGSSKIVTAGIVLLDRVLGLTGLLILALFALAFGYQQLSIEIASILAVIAFSILLVIALLLQGAVVRRLIAAIPDRLSRIRDNWMTPFTRALTGASKSNLIFAIIISMLNSVLTVINHYLVAIAVGIQLGIGLFFVFSPMVNLSLILPTISGLGLREIGYQILLDPFGVSANVAVALGLGVYLSRLSASIIGGIYYLYWNVRR